MIASYIMKIAQENDDVHGTWEALDTSELIAFDAGVFPAFRKRTQHLKQVAMPRHGVILSQNDAGIVSNYS